MNCETCKHWKASETLSGAEEGWGECKIAVAEMPEPVRGTRDKKPSMGVAQYHPASLVHVSPPGSASLLTSPRHSCGHWDGAK